MSKIARRDDDLRYRRHLSRLARSGLFPHPERLTPEFERRQRRLLRAFSRALRAGPPPCPHCGRTISAEDLEPERISRRGAEARREAEEERGFDRFNRIDGMAEQNTSRPPDGDD